MARRADAWQRTTARGPQLDLSPKTSMMQMPDLRHRLRQLRGFSRAFRNNAELIERHFGVRYHIDEKSLHAAFFNWIDALDAQGETAKLDRADYIVFCGGLALAELVRANPATIADLPARTGGDSDGESIDRANAEIVGFWPEGFLYTNFCICSIAAVQEQESAPSLNLEKAASDLRTWWSFRENATEDPAAAIPFLDSFFGLSPNWQYPMVARERQAIRKAILLASGAERQKSL